MKTITLTLLLIFSAVFFTSCNNDDDSTQTETLNGLWNLKNVSGGFSWVDVDYESGIVSWQFVSETNNLIVTSSVINNGPQSIYLPLESGNYNYTLTESNGKIFIQIENFGIFNNGDYGRYEINENGELIIDQGEGSEASASDVFTLLFD